MKKPSFDIHDGRAFALVIIFSAFGWLVYTGEISAETVKDLTYIAFGYLFKTVLEKKGGSDV